MVLHVVVLVLWRKYCLVEVLLVTLHLALLELGLLWRSLDLARGALLTRRGGEVALRVDLELNCEMRFEYASAEVEESVL